MILGIGTDIVDTPRITSMLTEFGDHFLQRVFLPEEITHCQTQAFPARHLAARFAAKEAVSKAFGTGIGKHLGWKDIEVGRRETGEPYIILHGKAAALCAQRGALSPRISMSHTDALALAFAILESKDPA
jgi:holo-[acyl-carrier protein] synthase